MSKYLRSYLVVFSIVAVFCSQAHASKVIGVLDGDTIDVLENGKSLRIRLANIDAPEKSQPFGQASKKSLSDLCYGKDATYTPGTIDRYGRTIAVIKCSGIEANITQVERGLAWVYEHYNRDTRLPALEKVARANHTGLWHDSSPTPPWEYRHKSIEQVAQNSSTCLAGPRGGRYQLVNGKKNYGC